MPLEVIRSRNETPRRSETFLKPARNREPFGLPSTTNRMTKNLLLASLLLLSLDVLAAASPTMRVDYYHTGNSTQEMFSLDRVVIEPLPWPGNPRKNIDETNLGKYLFEVRDRTTNRLLYSRGFASIYGEWESTDEAKNMNRTFSESLRFPAPQAPAQVVLKKRDSNN